MNTKLFHICFSILLFFAFIAASSAATNSVTTNASDCDFIVLKTGEVISAKVVKIGTNEIEYKNCDNPDGPLHTVKTQNVFMIKYANGTKEIINNKSEEPLSNSEPKTEGNSLSGFMMMLGALGLGAVVAILTAMVASLGVAAPFFLTPLCHWTS